MIYPSYVIMSISFSSWALEVASGHVAFYPFSAFLVRSKRMIASALEEDYDEIRQKMTPFGYLRQALAQILILEYHL